MQYSCAGLTRKTTEVKFALKKKARSLVVNDFPL